MLEVRVVLSPGADVWGDGVSEEAALHASEKLAIHLREEIATWWPDAELDISVGSPPCVEVTCCDDRQPTAELAIVTYIERNWTRLEILLGDFVQEEKDTQEVLPRKSDLCNTDLLDEAMRIAGELSYTHLACLAKQCMLLLHREYLTLAELDEITDTDPSIT